MTIATQIPPSPSPWARLRRALESERRAEITGIVGAARGAVVRDLLEASGRPGAVLAVAADEEEADALARDVAFFAGAAKVAREPGPPSSRSRVAPPAGEPERGGSAPERRASRSRRD